MVKWGGNSTFLTPGRVEAQIYLSNLPNMASWGDNFQTSSIVFIRGYVWREGQSKHSSGETIYFHTTSVKT